MAVPLQPRRVDGVQNSRGRGPLPELLACPGLVLSEEIPKVQPLVAGALACVDTDE